jgi:hypothetical protein
MKRLMLRSVLTLVVISLLSLFAVPFASAHGHTEVGDYELIIGFKVEPAFQGEPNGLDLTIRRKDNQEPVKDLADKLKVELISGSNKRELAVRPQFGKDGAYTADVLPTAAGDYTWHISGDINGTPLDVSMTSGEDTFGAVQTKSAVSFPGEEPASTTLMERVSAAEEAASQARLLGIAGAVLGLIGIAAGVMGLRGRRAA